MGRNRQVFFHIPYSLPKDIINMNPKEEAVEGFSSLTVRRLAYLVVDHLAKFGFCVIDDFLGKVTAEKIKSEVSDLHSSQEKENDTCSIKSRTTWVNSSEKDATNKPLVGFQSFIKALDSVIFVATRILNVQIKSRRKALVSLQTNPSSISESDSPSEDMDKKNKPSVEDIHKKNKPSLEDMHKKKFAKCVQAIYYPNKNWNTEVDGGMMEVSPSKSTHLVEEVYPIFDRVLIVWADTRTTKKLKTSFSDRLEINVWYFYDLIAKKREVTETQNDQDTSVAKKKEGLENIISDIKRQKTV